MNLDQREARRSAAREFLEALDQLQASLEALDSKTQLDSATESSTQPALDDAHQAVAPSVSQPMSQPAVAPPQPSYSSGRSANYGRLSAGTQQLKSTLSSSRVGSNSREGSSHQRKGGVRFTLKDLESAIADIDRYMESRGEMPSSSLEDELE